MIPTAYQKIFLIGVGVILISAYLVVCWTRLYTVGDVVEIPDAHLSASPYVTDTEGFIDYVRELLIEKGATEMQVILKEAYRNAPYGDQHMAFHYFGEVLYKTHGATFLPQCTDLYGFGCYHGFLLDAIDAEGYTIVPSLDEACREKHGETMETETCQHGIGHGLLEYTGRDPLEAVASCDLVADVYPKLGCASGVFMEYFSPTQSGIHNNVSLLPAFDEMNPLNVCSTLTGTRLSTCLFEIHGWWELMGVTPTEVESLCNTVGEDAAREFCLIGYGNFKGPIVTKALPFCDQLTTQESRTLCRAGVFWASSHHYQAADAPRSCLELEGTYSDTCFKKGRFTCDVEKNCPSDV